MLPIVRQLKKSFFTVKLIERYSIITEIYLEIINAKFKSCVPGGQTRELQVLTWRGNPGHSSPPLDFGGLLQCLDLFCTPVPQLLLQAPKDVQPPHLPSTKKIEFLNIHFSRI